MIFSTLGPLKIPLADTFKHYFTSKNTFTQVHVSRVVEFHLLTLVPSETSLCQDL
uniref:Uncharacterized protein n=1 Tax=Helianthus annuus TaxID=4232 RepID=A0A251V0F0_HELAN